MTKLQFSSLTTHLSILVDVGVDEAGDQELVELLVGGGVAVSQSLGFKDKF